MAAVGTLLSFILTNAGANPSGIVGSTIKGRKSHQPGKSQSICFNSPFAESAFARTAGIVSVALFRNLIPDSSSAPSGAPAAVGSAAFVADPESRGCHVALCQEVAAQAASDLAGINPIAESGMRSSEGVGFSCLPGKRLS
jgi:hypothetical protein